MEISSRLSAFVAYLLPLVGWLYVGLVDRKDPFARFHLRQAVGLVIFLLLVAGLYLIAGWLITWIPYGFIFAIASFALVMAVAFVGVVLWVIGLFNALAGRREPLPLIGRRAARLPL